MNKSLDTDHQHEPTATLMNNKLAEALTELQQANRDITTLNKDSNKVLDRCTEIKKKTKIADDRGNDNRKAIRKYEADIEAADMEEMKRFSVQAFEEIKFELRKYHGAACTLNLLKKKHCQMREPRLKVSAPFVNPEGP